MDLIVDRSRMTTVYRECAVLLSVSRRTSWEEHREQIGRDPEGWDEGSQQDCELGYQQSWSEKSPHQRDVVRLVHSIGLHHQAARHQNLHIRLPILLPFSGGDSMMIFEAAVAKRTETTASQAVTTLVSSR
jgi:hypothetical protein